MRRGDKRRGEGEGQRERGKIQNTLLINETKLQYIRYYGGSN
jgi:hypothetical protein